jgi:hypothetical protein
MTNRFRRIALLFVSQPCLPAMILDEGDVSDSALAASTSTPSSSASGARREE